MREGGETDTVDFLARRGSVSVQGQREQQITRLVLWPDSGALSASFCFSITLFLSRSPRLTSSRT